MFFQLIKKAAEIEKENDPCQIKGRFQSIFNYPIDFKSNFPHTWNHSLIEFSPEFVPIHLQPIYLFIF
jgi:hypothetical protein